MNPDQMVRRPRVGIFFAGLLYAGFLCELRVAACNPLSMTDYWRRWKLDQVVRHVAVMELSGRVAMNDIEY